MLNQNTLILMLISFISNRDAYVIKQKEINLMDNLPSFKLINITEQSQNKSWCRRYLKTQSEVYNRKSIYISLVDDKNILYATISPRKDT